MKTLTSLLLLLLIAQIGVAQTDSLTKLEIAKDLESLSLSNANDTANYVIGMIFSKQLETLPKDITIDNMMLLKGFIAAQQEKEIFSFEDANKMLMQIIAPSPPANATTEEVVEVEEKIARPKAKMTPDEMIFFVQNGKRAEVTTLETGIQYELLLGSGRGASPKLQDDINVFFFAEYEENGETIRLQDKDFVNIKYQSIQWQEVFQLLKIGSTYRFYLPSSYNQTAPNKFVANKDDMITVDIELVEIRPSYSYEDEDDY